jgi:clan AA aspartic protease (TIGR02281 family)
MNQVALTAAAVVLSWAVVACGTQKDRTDLDHLYRSRQWFELRASVDEESPDLVRGAVAAAFNDSMVAERLLRNVVRSQPQSTSADDAYALLSQIYIRSGRYQRFVSNYTDWVAAFPESDAARQTQDAFDIFRDRPDQLNPPQRHVLLLHADEFAVPVTIDGKTNDFLFDTGAWHSVLTERMADKLGLTTSERTGLLTGASGMKLPFRTVIVKEVMIGDMTFRDVSFAVVTGGPFADVEAGIVGMPILLVFGGLRWANNGMVELGIASLPMLPAERNLVFDRNHLLVQASTLGRNVLMTLDTGATTTDLNTNFASLFPDVVAHGKKGTQDITGVGGTASFDSIELPEVVFTFGPTNVGLRPAHVTLQRLAGIGGECCIGNAGHDLLTQRQTFAIDFGTMTLQLK